MACDEEAYTVFSELIGPIVEDLHPKFDFRYAYNFDEINLIRIIAKMQEMETELSKVDYASLRMRRNFRGMPFTPLMT